MTNNEIITREAIAAGIITKEEATAIMKTGRRIPVHTYSEWKQLGYQVKTGEHAAIVTFLWRFGKPQEIEINGKKETVDGDAYRAKAHLFTAAQVEKAVTRTIKSAEEIRAYNKMLAEQRRARATA